MDFFSFDLILAALSITRKEAAGYKVKLMNPEKILCKKVTYALIYILGIESAFWIILSYSFAKFDPPKLWWVKIS